MSKEQCYICGSPTLFKCDKCKKESCLDHLKLYSYGEDSDSYGYEWSARLCLDCWDDGVGVRVVADALIAQIEQAEDELFKTLDDWIGWKSE